MTDSALQLFRDRCVIEPLEFEAWLDEKKISWQRLDRGEYEYTLEQVQIRYVMEDPVRFARAYMDDPDNGDRPWEFWDYQIPSIRAWHQDSVHQDGAEVGKTREIVVLVVWGAVTGFGFSVRNPWLLIGAPQQTHLDEIIMAVNYHMGAEEEGMGRSSALTPFWVRPKKHPHYMHRFHGMFGRAQAYYRPAGHDGDSFRGVHVNGAAIMDESAKVRNKLCWSEFRRAKKPGCVERVYSVPSGERDTEYYRLCQSAVPNLAPGEPGVRLFHWPKTLMPSPFWSPERRKKFIADYGGVDSPGYQRNVLGEHGQAENPVFPWHQMEPNLHNVPQYRCLKLMADNQNGEMEVTAYSIELAHEKNRKYGKRHILIDRTDDLDRLKHHSSARDAVYRLLREVFDPPDDGVYWAGADLGYAKDPTEIRIWREIGEDIQCVARIRAKGVSYDIQCELIYNIDRIFGFKAGWGVDFGNAGTAVVQMLQSQEIYQDGHYEDRMTGFQFSTAVDCVDEDGEMLTQEDEKTGAEKGVRKPAKEWATDLITSRMQRVAFVQPYDEDVISDYTNHTAREGQRNLIFSKDNDHVIDADRAMMLRRVFDEMIGGVDVFSSGVFVRGAA